MCVPLEPQMRELVVRRFDVVIVIWVLALAIGWSYCALARTELTNTQWSSAPQSGPAWVVTDLNATR
jgi:hypothetical protein